MKVDRDVQFLRGFEQSCLVALHVDTGEGRDALLSQSDFRQRAAEKVEYLFRTRSPAATNAGDERRRTVDDCGTWGLYEPVGDEDQGSLPSFSPDDIFGQGS